MPLAPGHRLGPYQVVATLGAGGMGEVYRARDTALGRDVAIKVLPDLFAKDPERMARLTREARALAALSHPNIAHVHGLDETGTGPALVMELVEGEDLADRIARGPIPPAEAVPIARQMAEALEAAHEQGIVHRDLKPANIRIRPDGTVKVLDFGLAKAVGPQSPGSGPGADAATFTAGPSEHGVILGSAAYMAPEQARGRAVDKRADIWAFGAVLYEMLAGTRAFRGEGFSDILAAVLRSEIDWNALPAETPVRLRHLLERCLTSDVRQRLRDIGEARVVLAALERSPGEKPTAGATAPRGVARREGLAWAVAALAIAAAIFTATRLADSGRSSTSGAVTRLSVLAPPGLRLNPDSANVAISPDGRLVALVVGRGIAAENQLWVRSLDSPVARRIESGDGVSLPFWSPDSTRIGFFASRKLKVVDAGGGPAVVVCDAPFPRGGTWNRSNVIVFAPDAQGTLSRVPASGGTPEPVTRLNAARQHAGHRFPSFLPDGDRFLYAAIPGGGDGFDILVDSLSGAGTVLVGRMESAPVYADPGWLLFARQRVLMAQRFDPRTLKLTADPVSLGDQPGVAPSPAAYEAGPRASAAASGALAYYLPAPADTTVHWIDKAGRVLGEAGVPAAQYTNVSLAPDDTRAVLVRTDPSGTWSLWLIDLPRAGAVPLVTEGRNKAPVWSPDGKWVVFASERNGEYAFYRKAAGDAAPEVRLARFNDQSAEPRGWSSDGAWIIFNRVDPGTRWNVYRFPAGNPDKPEVIVNGPAVEVGGRMSPDGRWLAYLSDETGRLDVFLRSIDPSGPKLQISTGGVQGGWWTRDGRELLFLKRDQTMWRVPLDLSGEAPRLGATQQIGTFPPGVVSMDLTRDGRFLAIVAERSEGGAVTVVQSWQSALPLAK